MVKKKTILLLGASFSTGNLGVSALAWSSIKVIKKRWPGAEISLIGPGKQVDITSARLGDHEITLQTYPVRYCKNFLTPHHILKMGVAVFCFRILPFTKFLFCYGNSTISALINCDLVCDITGGDSFSDIYGLNRFARGYLLKRICQITGKPFILLPQTYGPFKTSLARTMARRILKKASIIFSRDQIGLQTASDLKGNSKDLYLCPDVAFVMDAFRPLNFENNQSGLPSDTSKGIIGININGLLYNGGYTRNNMFKLTSNYQQLIMKIILYFLEKTEKNILLVPHVLPSSAFIVEDDYLAGKNLLDSFPLGKQKRVTIIEKGFDQNETKYIIGLCDFFIGSRMHAAIAALSQEIPAVGLAYSRKFAGVFATIGVEDCVLDLRYLNTNRVIEGITKIYKNRNDIKNTLKENIPKVKNNVLSLFNNFEL